MTLAVVSELLEAVVAESGDPVVADDGNQIIDGAVISQAGALVCAEDGAVVLWDRRAVAPPPSGGDDTAWLSQWIEALPLDTEVVLGGRYVLDGVRVELSFEGLTLSQFHDGVVRRTK